MVSRLALAAALLSVGCSLTGLSDLDLALCETNQDCRALNVIHDVDESCHAFFCQAGRCLRRGEGVEVLDGYDNDCDGVVDEPSRASGSEPVQTIVVEPVFEAGGVASSTAVDVAFGVEVGGAASALWFDADGLGWLSPIAGESAEATALEYARGAREPGGHDDPLMTNVQLEPDCYRWSGEEVVPATCDFGEIALDRHNGRSVIATVDTAHCAEGLLRVGYTDANDRHGDHRVIHRGPLRRSNSYLGIDDTGNGCSGASRPTCRDGDVETCGAARPSVAMLASDDAPSQALVGFLGARQGRPSCGGPEVNVEVLSAFLMIDDIGETYGWVTVSGEGIPRVIGKTTGGGAPSVVALNGGGFLVGFGDERGRLALSFLAEGEPPPESDWSCSTCDQLDRTGLEVPQLHQPVELGSLDGGGGVVDYVAIAQGDQHDDVVDVGVSWTEGCGTSDEIVFFRKVQLAVAAGVPESIVDEGDIVQVSLDLQASAGRLGPQSIIYLDRGFLVAGTSRGGGVVDETTDGGWLVVWAERSNAEAPARLLGRRLSEYDGGLLDDEEVLDLTLPDSAASHDSRAPLLYTDEAGLRYAYHDRSGGRILGGRLIVGH